MVDFCDDDADEAFVEHPTTLLCTPPPAAFRGLPFTRPFRRVGMTTTSSSSTSPPTTESEAYDALGLRRGADESEIKAKFRALALTTHPDAVSGDRERFRAIVRAKEILLRSSSSSSPSSSWGGFTAAETAARRASENKLPRHFHGFVFATAAVLVGVAYVRTNAGDRKEARSPLVRHALGLPERKSADGGC